MTNTKLTSIKQNSDDNSVVLYKALLRTITILAAFSLSVLVLMLVNNHQLGQSDPRNSNELKIVKLQLHRKPTSEALKARVREVDSSLRKSYLRQLDFANTGSYLLLIGIAGLLITIPAAAQYRKKMVLPEKAIDGTDEMRRTARLARTGIAVLGVVVVGGFTVLAMSSSHGLIDGYTKAVNDFKKNPPASFTEPGKEAPVSSAAGSASSALAPAAASAPGAPVPLPSLANLPALPPMPGASAPNSGSPVATKPAETQTTMTVKLAVEAAYDSNDYFPSVQDYHQNWPVFRGPSAGIAADNYPTDWNGPSGKAILWKTQIALPGWNSPVVWKDRVFLAGADKQKREIYCYNADDGKLLWTKTVDALVGGQPPKVFDDTGYAAPTMAVDGKRVFAIFPNGDVVCYSFDGNQLWGRNLGSPDSMYGYAASLAMFRSLLIIQLDQGSGSDGQSAIMALQGSTGKIVWLTQRDVANSWSSPLVVNSADAGMVITNANPWSIGYEALSGKELWRANVMSGDVAPSPAYMDGIAYVCNTGAVLAAIRTNGSGDVTKSNVLWQATDGLPDITSPATNGEFLILLTTEGTATCIDAKLGKKLWDHSFDTMFRSSPVIIGNKAYLLDGDGVMHIITLKQSFLEDGQSSIGEKTNATPAFTGGRIYIRGENNLFCVGSR